MAEKDWKDIVAKLLRKAEDPATTTEERDTINDRVTYLMAKYGIEQAILDANNKVDLKIVAIRYPFTTYAKQQKKLLYNIGKIFGLESIDIGEVLTVYGYPDDQEKVFLLYNSIRLQMFTALTAAQTQKPAHEHGRTFNTSFIVNFIEVVLRRMRSAYAQAVNQTGTDTESTAIVLRDRRTAVMNEMRIHHPRMRMIRSTSTSRSGLGAALGTAAGHSANIGQTGVGGSRKEIR